MNSDLDKKPFTPISWPVGTRVTMTNVPWDSQYRDIVAWDDADQLEGWFQGKMQTDFFTYTSDKYSYLPYGRPVRVKVPYSTAYKYNYLYVENPEQPVDYEGEQYAGQYPGGRKLYYFILSVDYVNPQTSYLTLQFDVITSRQFQFSIESMFVTSGHVACSNRNVIGGAEENDPANLTGEMVRRYLTVPEGLDCGRDYVMANHEWYPLTDAETGKLGAIIVVSSVNLAADPGDVNNPRMNVADGQYADGIPGGCNVYAIEQNDFKAWMKEMQDKSWAAQGIVSISTFPKRLLSQGADVKLFGSGTTMYFLGETDTLENGMNKYATTGNVFNQLSNGIPALYQHYLKFYSFPYSFIEITAWNGNSVLLKPEGVRGNAIDLFVIGCAVAPFARVGVFPRNYGTAAEGNDPVPDNDFSWVGFDEKQHVGTIPAGDFLDTVLWLGDFPQFSIVNNSYLTYMASTAHTRAYQYQSAGWALDKSNAAAKLANMQANMRIDTAQANYNATLQGLQANTANRMLSSPILSEDTRFSSDSPANAAVRAVGNTPLSPLLRVSAGAALDAGFTVIAGARSNLPGWGTPTEAIGNLTGFNQFQNQQNLARYTADSNLAYANYANQGDYRNAIAGINAAVQDAQLQPPSVAGQMGGQGFNWKNGLVGFAVNYKTIGGAAARIVGAFWARYGYNVNEFMAAPSSHPWTLRDLRVMSKFSYWQVQQVYLGTSSYATEEERDAIRGILEKGVTVWADPDKIGDIDPSDNAPTFTISY